VIGAVDEKENGLEIELGAGLEEVSGLLVPNPEKPPKEVAAGADEPKENPPVLAGLSA
jgi:hypothetical protein